MKRKAMGWVVAGAVMFAVASQVLAQPSPGGGVAASGAESNVKATKAANRKLRRDVLRALAKTPGLNNERISVRANGGAVTLSGSVPVADQIQKAGDAARQVSGVNSLSNRITLRSYN